MVRALVWRDLTAIHRFQKQYMFLDNDLRLTYNPGLFSSSLLSILTSSSGFCTAVRTIESDRYPFLIGQSFLLPGDHSARLTLLAPGNQDHEGFDDLLAFISTRTGESGAQQIVAEVDQDSLENAILFRSGFRAYAQQQIWKLPRKSFTKRSPSSWTPITRGNGAQVISAYQRIVPPLVQRVEAPPAGYIQQGMISWQGERIAAIAFTNFGPKGILIDLIFEPDLPELEAHLVDLFSHLPYRNSREIYLRVRSYQERLASVLEDIGAAAGPAQEALVKRLAVHYNAKQTFRVQAFEEQPDVTAPISNTKVKT